MAHWRPTQADLNWIRTLPGCAAWSYETDWWPPCSGAMAVFLNIAGHGNTPLGAFQQYTANWLAGGAQRIHINNGHWQAANQCLGVPFPAGTSDAQMCWDNWACRQKVHHPVYGEVELFAPPRHPNMAGVAMQMGWQQNHRTSLNLMSKMHPASSPDPASGAVNFSPLLRRLCVGWRLLVNDAREIAEDAAFFAAHNPLRRNGRFPDAMAGAAPNFPAHAVHLPVAIACAVDGPWLAFKLAWGLQRCMGHFGNNHLECQKQLQLRRRATDPNNVRWINGHSDPELGMHSRVDHMCNGVVKCPSWWRRVRPPRAPLAASEGLGLPSAPVRSDLAPPVSPRGRVPGARPRPRRNFRRVRPSRYNHTMPNPTLVRWAAHEVAKTAAVWPVHGGPSHHRADNMGSPQCPSHTAKGPGVIN